jgi:signal transduction histidine kinase
MTAIEGGLKREACSTMQLARERRRRHVAVGAIIFLAVCLSWPPSRSLRAEAPGGKHVLVLFSHESATYADFDRPLRASLTRDLTYPVDFFTEYLDLLRFPRDRYEQQIVDALRVKYRGRRLDLIVVVSPLALDFLMARRDELFSGVPIVFASINVDRFRGQPPPANVTGVAVRRDYRDTVNLALGIHPDTQRVIVPVGTSAVERSWLESLRESFKEYEGRVAITYPTDLPMHEIERRLQTLQPHSLILFAPMLYTDSAGDYFRPEDIAALVSASSSVPVYGTDEPFLGKGIVGGVLYDMAAVGVAAGRMGQRILSGEQASQIPIQTMDANRTAFDARQLKRWGINERRLPPGSAVFFREPTLWTQYRAAVIATATIVAGQTAVVSLLLIQGARRRRAEVALRESERRLRATVEQNQDLAGRLIHAQEAERSRIARDLHDDISQQLASVGIMLSLLKRNVGRPGSESKTVQTVSTLQDRTSTLAEAIRNLSHELHPGMLEHSGLVTTLRRHCADVERLHHLTVTFSTEGNLDSLSPDVALCLFRVAQEALANAVRHARAHTILVQLTATDHSLELSIIDDGIGFATADCARSGLGLRSIDERVRLAGGSMQVESRLGDGTALRVRISRVPLDLAAPLPFASESGV